MCIYICVCINIHGTILSVYVVVVVVCAKKERRRLRCTHTQRTQQL